MNHPVRTHLVTGAGSGSGTALVSELHERGDGLVLLARSKQRADDLAASYPGTELYRQAQEQGWLPRAAGDLVNRDGVQVAALDYPGLMQTEIFDSVEAFYRRFYFRPRKMVAMVGGMLRDPAVMRRRLREGVRPSSRMDSSSTRRPVTGAATAPGPGTPSPRSTASEISRN